jgi:hypothetical protein
LSRKAPFALQAFAPAPNEGAFFLNSSIEHAVVEVTAKGTFHEDNLLFPVISVKRRNALAWKKAFERPRAGCNDHYVISENVFLKWIAAATLPMALIVTVSALPMTAVAKTQIDDSTGRLVNQSDSSSDSSSSGSADTVETPHVKPATQVGPAAAEKYFKKKKDREPADDGNSDGQTSGSVSSPHYGDHSLSLGIGGFLAGDTYSWGSTPHNTGAGRMNAEMTYRMGAVSALADWSLRVDYLGYGLPEGNAAELAFSPVLMIPEATSKFPVYFGIGAGPGVFVQQVSQQSSICLNYQIFGGLRFYDVLENTGFFMEAGLKNNFLLTSLGQFNGTYLATGAVFTF